MVEYENIRREDFCKEKECRLYILLTQLNFFENPSPLVKRQKELIKIRCRQNCEHTAQEFYQWMTKANN